MLLPALAFAVGGCMGVDPPAPVGVQHSALTADQCTYFADSSGNDYVCHATRSTKNPYVLLYVALSGCDNHATNHPNDFIDTENPPSCNTEGCLPNGAPYDPKNTLQPCCGNLTGASGTCECATGLTWCLDEAACEDLQSDTNNCGSCGNVCPTGASCVNGACECPTGDTVCGTAPGACKNLQTDGANCGSCGNACATGTTCCGGGCTDTTTDLDNCGTCGNACSTSVANATATCTSSTCGFACNSGFSLCGGACVDEQTDDKNCGGCGTVCSTTDPNGSSSCSSGQCVLVCNAGYTNCNGVCVDEQTDNNNCGGCGTVCSTTINDGTSSCAAGQCVLGCAGSYSLCGGACVNEQSDPNNCGSCGNKCASGICSAGACSSPMQWTGSYWSTNYCTVNPADYFSGRSNQNTCGYFAQNIQFHNHVDFTVSKTTTFTFGYGPDFGYGGYLQVDGVTLDQKNYDLWWGGWQGLVDGGNWNNTSQTLSGTVTLAPGAHAWDVYGGEGCCDGTVGARFQCDSGNGPSGWRDFTASAFYNACQ